MLVAIGVRLMDVTCICKFPCVTLQHKDPSLIVEMSVMLDKEDRFDSEKAKEIEQASLMGDCHVRQSNVHRLHKLPNVGTR